MNNTLTKYRLGNFIETLDLRNSDDKYGAKSVVGLSTQKTIITTKADLSGVKLSSYKLFPSGSFAYVPDTSRRGDKMSMAYNSSNETYLVSSISIVFKVINPDKLLAEYLFMFFNRSEFDRYARFNSWGSAREAFSCNEMQDIEIELPPIEVQQKYVDIYKSMLENQKCYESALDDLKLICDAYIEDLRRKNPCEKIKPYIKELNERNTKLNIHNVQGVNNSGTFSDTKANMTGIDIHNYKIVKNGQFAYNPSRINLGSIALLQNSDCIVSPMYVVFEVADKNKLLPEYLMMWYSRKEFHRSTLFYATGSVRDTFDFNAMQEVKIPIPDIEIQRSISDIYKIYIERKQINEKLKSQIKEICPVLIKGSIENGKI